MDNKAITITTDRELWREAIQITLAHRAGEAPDASAVAESTIAIWSQMAALLTPVIGTQGVGAIFRRSLYLTSKTFHWLDFGENQRDGAALFASLKEHLAGRDADEAGRAGYTALATFIKLLATLIGESLTERLLSSVWTSPTPFSKKELNP